MGHMLEVKGLSKRFGGLTAVADVSFAVDKGEIFGIIGPNGAGKTTLFNVIAGLYRPNAGSVALEGHDITGHSSDEVARRGIARTFQAIHVFQRETAAENLRRAEVIATNHSPLSYLMARFRSGKDDLNDVATFMGLTESLDYTAGSLPYGLQKRLGLGMAMMVAPKVLLMDEPAAGLNSSEKKDARALILKLRGERGISILIVEHDMPLVMGICDRVLVLNQGKLIALGTPGQIKSDPHVIEAYLGEDYEFA